MSFGTWDGICSEVSLILCPLVGTFQSPSCYARNIDFGPNRPIFQPATLLIHIIALIMGTIMIYHIRSKYTAVGRKEIVLFFYMYIALTLLELFLLSNVIPVSWVGYPYFASIHAGLLSALCWCLLLNGFVGFQWAEDGTAMSLWSLRISSSVVFTVVTLISLATVQSFAPFSPANSTALWFLYFIFNGGMLLIYVILQIILVLNTLEDRWPLGDILFGAGFFAIGQAIEYGVSTDLCEQCSHYLDGLFFGTICSLLGVMMVYKYWDSITTDTLEFAVGTQAHVWQLDETDRYGHEKERLYASDDNSPEIDLRKRPSPVAKG